MIIYIADISYLCDKAEYEKAYSALPLFRKKKADDIKNGEEKLLSVGAWALLSLACRENGIGGYERDIITGEHGKPYFSKGGAYFNISHSGTKVMCAISEKEVGCDIQIIRGGMERLAKRFLSEKENGVISSLWGKERDAALIKIWSAKESAVKCSGIGFSKGDFKSAEVSEDSVKLGVDDFPLYSFEYDGYVVTVCSYDTEYKTVFPDKIP